MIRTSHPLKPRRALLLATALALASPLALAQSNWPTKPVTIVVPFPAGGGTDAFARPLSAHLTKVLGKQFIIDNRGGAGGTVGASLAARAAPDGYTLFMGAVHHAIAPSMYPKLDYNIETDFVPIGLVSSVPQVIVVNPQRMPQADFKAFLAAVRSNPGKYNYASAGNGTSHHLAGELFKLQSQTFITHIPYRGAGPALQDLIAGQVDMMFDGLGSSAAHIRGGRIKALAVASDKRSPSFPDVPTAAEMGLPDYQVATWYGLWAPKGTPKDVADRIQAELRKALNSEEIIAVWRGIGSITPDLYGDAYGRFVSSEVKRWAEVVKSFGRQAGVMSGSVRLLAADAAGVARVLISHPGKLNALSVAMWHELRAIFDALNTADAPPRVLLLHGDGGHFVAGGDIEEFPSFRFDEQRLRALPRRSGGAGAARHARLRHPHRRADRRPLRRRRAGDRRLLRPAHLRPQQPLRHPDRPAGLSAGAVRSADRRARDRPDAAARAADRSAAAGRRRGTGARPRQPCRRRRRGGRRGAGRLRSASPRCRRRRSA